MGFMRLRLQKLDDSDWGWGRVRVATQVAPDAPWSVAVIRQHKLGTYLQRAGIEDVRDRALLGQQASAARREWGHEGGFAEWTRERSERRFAGDLLREVSD